MDGDVFGKVTRLGRAAAQAVLRALDGGPWDAFHASKCLDVLLGAAGGIPMLRLVADELQALRNAPLLARANTAQVLERIRHAAHGKGCTQLDLILRGVVERSLLRGDYESRGILERFCGTLLDRAVLCGRRGFLEQYGSARLDAARAVLAPVASAAAAVLDLRPEAKRLGLSRSYADVSPETNLLGGW